MNFYPSPEDLKKGGVILIDKPYKWTSFDAINLIKITLRIKIGHCGTLDPLATGLLICCTEEQTKNIKDYQQLPKEYTGIFRLGATTATNDLESIPENFLPFEQISEEQIRGACISLTGDIMQVPPDHSAIKVDGKRSYDLARAGKEFKLDSRPVTIGEFEIIAIKLPEIHFRIACTTGTYIRSIARDLGVALGCGAYLHELRRTKIGNFKVENALTPNAWKDYWNEKYPNPNKKRI